jgi:HK97 family phage major capsid protein
MTAKKLIELKQERANLVTQMREIHDRYDDKVMEGEDLTTYTNAEIRFEELNASIEAEEKLLARERAIGEKLPDAPKDETRELFAKALGGRPADIAQYLAAAPTLGDDGQAGYLTAPVQFVADLIKGLDDYLFIRRLARVVGPIGAAQSLGFPYRKTAASDATWVPEVTVAPEETNIEYGRREFKPNKMAKLLKVSRTLMRHAPMAESTLREEIVMRIGTGAENAYLNGDGTAKPLGLFVANAAGIDTDRDIATGNTATTITFDGIKEAKFNIKQQYWANAQWLMHRDAVKMLAKIKDGNGQYVWQPSVISGQPDRLDGHPVNMSEYAPNTFTTGLYVGIFGDFKRGYWIADADTLRVQVLNELYAVTNQTGYLVEYFGDGAPVLPEAFSRIKLA